MAESSMARALDGMTPKEALKSFTPEERKLFNPISTHLDRDTERTIESNWKLGKLLAIAYRRIHDPASSGAGRDARKRPYREFFFERMALAKGYQTPKFFHNCLRVYDAYQPEAEGDDERALIRKYHQLRGPAGNMLSWTHIVLLAGIADLQIRLKIANRCLAENWSTKRLQQFMQPPAERRHAGGRKSYVPRDLPDALVHIQQSCQSFSNLIQNSWLGDSFDLVRAFHDDLPASEVTDELCGAIRDAEERAQELYEQAEQLVGILASLQSDAEQVRAQQGIEADDPEVAAV